MSPASSHRSRCLVWVKSVSPRSRILRKPARRHRGDGLVQEDVRLLLRGAVAAAIDQVERFGRVGQRDQQRMVTPVAVVGDVDRPACTRRRSGHDGAIGLEDRFLEELGGLLGPDPQPRFIDGVHQGEDVGSEKRRQKSPAVVGSGMRSAPKASR